MIIELVFSLVTNLNASIMSPSFQEENLSQPTHTQIPYLLLLRHLWTSLKSLNYPRKLIYLI